jgi:two-component system LytT family sensor kinase
MNRLTKSDFIEKHYWIHVLFWLFLSVYFFVSPELYKWGVKPVLYTGVVFYLTYGGAYVFTVKYIAPRFFVQKKIGKGLLFILLTASVQQLIFGPLSNYFLTFNNPFLQWFLFNLPFSCTVLLLASGVSVFTDYLYVVRKVQQLEIIKAQQEIFLLKSQINPHFLFNTLNSLYSLARSKSDKTEKAILQLSELMRYLMEISKRDVVLLSDEIRFLTSYIEMEKLRLNGDAVCTFHISPQEFKPYKIPPLLLLPFVENAFKHGAEQNPGKVHIEAYLSIQDDGLFFEITNAVAPVAPATNSGTGIQNLNKRLDLIYKDNYRLDIGRTEQKYRVNLYLKL